METFISMQKNLYFGQSLCPDKTGVLSLQFF